MPIRSREIHALSSRIQLPVLRKLLSLMDGHHSSTRAGRGWDFLDLADYHPGDDVSTIDWAATARSGTPIVKRFEASANMQVILIVDTGRAMGARAPSGESKEDIAVTACEAIAWLSVARGDQIGLVGGDSQRMRHMPARSGNAHAELLIRKIRQDITLDSPPSDVPRLLNHAMTATRRRSLFVIVSDETQPAPNAHTDEILKKIRTRHEVIAVSVADADPSSLPKGTRIIDVDEGPLPDFILGDTQLAQQARTVVNERRTSVSELLSKRGVLQVSAASSQEVPRALMFALSGGRHVG